jgi:hypothetical protein
MSSLELWTKPHPPGIRVKDILKWAREIIKIYEPIEEKLDSDSLPEIGTSLLSAGAT